MKTIAWVTPSYFLDTDLFVVKNICKFYHIDWFILKEKGCNLDFSIEIKTLADALNLTINILEHKRNRQFLSQLLFYFQLQQKMKKADIVYQPSGMPYALPIMVLFGKRKKTVVPIHNVNTPKGGSFYYMNKIGGKLVRGFFSYFVTFSKSQYYLLTSLTKGKRILYAPFYLKDYGKPNKKRTSNLIAFMNFGIIREYKRIDVLIEAAQKAFEETKIEFRVIIAGGCPNWGKYQSLIKYPKLFDLRIGRVEDLEIPNLFEECDYFVTPYQDIAQSGSLIVAINYNKPIIASKLDAFEEYVSDGENGFLIRPANVDDLRDRIVYVLRNHENIYERLKKKQREMIERDFSDIAITERYLNFFDTL
ncbi:MAG: glycosyltransferase [Salinivirgaceae bacterium]|nr:glycosyltransferase [Salinivirgaceae bacterium]